MSQRPKAKTYVDIIPKELRARYEELHSRHFNLITAGRVLDSDDWAELARIEEAQADVLSALHKLFFEADPLIAGVLNAALTRTRRDAEGSRKNAAALRGER